eukprot:scaffold325_cov343-Pavlova_lutheri.AAC.19
MIYSTGFQGKLHIWPWLDKATLARLWRLLRPVSLPARLRLAHPTAWWLCRSRFPPVRLLPAPPLLHASTRLRCVPKPWWDSKPASQASRAAEVHRWRVHVAATAVHEASAWRDVGVPRLVLRRPSQFRSPNVGLGFLDPNRPVRSPFIGALERETIGADRWKGPEGRMSDDAPFGVDQGPESLNEHYRAHRMEDRNGWDGSDRCCVSCTTQSRSIHLEETSHHF